MGVPRIQFIQGDDTRDVATGQFVDEEAGVASAYMTATHFDQDDNTMGGLDLSVGGYVDEDRQFITYWASATSFVYGTDENGNPHRGWANAWVRVPERVAHDQGGEGDALVSADGNNSMSASDSVTLDIQEAGNNKVEASAALSAQGYRSHIKIKVTGV